MTRERLLELSEELEFLELCELAFLFSKKTEMAIRWTRGRVTVAIRHAKKPRRVVAT